MEFAKLLEIVGNEPVFETGLLLSGDIDADDVRKQLSRWVAAGKVLQLRRGLYSLAPPYQKTVPHPFLVANRLKPASYVSLQSALAYYGMIPELVPLTTSVSTGRPETLHTPLGEFEFRHIQTGWFHSYHQIDPGNGQVAFMATPEKAVLDLVYLQPGGHTLAYLRELRLQALDQLDLNKLRQEAEKKKKPRLIQAVRLIQQLAEEEAAEYKTL